MPSSLCTARTEGGLLHRCPGTATAGLTSDLSPGARVSSRAQAVARSVLLLTRDTGAGRDGSSNGQQLADWSSLGGLQPVVRQLKEMVILPLLYPALYRQMGITAPRSALLTLRTTTHAILTP